MVDVRCALRNGDATSTGGMRGLLAAFLYPFQLSEKDTTVDVIHMQYACGECHVQYRVLKAGDANGQTHARTFGNESDTPMRFIGWDVVVLHKGSDKPLLKYRNVSALSAEACASPVLRLRGQFKRKLLYTFLYSGGRYDGIYFDAHTASIVPQDRHGCKANGGASIR
jgi:hypothetical protein